MSLSVLGIASCGLPFEGGEIIAPSDDPSVSPPDGDEADESGESEGVVARDAGAASGTTGTTRDAGTTSSATRDAGTTSTATRDAGTATSSTGSSTTADAGTSTTPAPVSNDGALASTTGSGGTCAVPQEAQLEDVSNPTTVVGTGTPSSCTSSAFVAAVAKGGVITFDCGPNPVTITLTQTAKVFNDKGPKVVIDGGNKVTLSGGGKVRILYQNTCDQQQTWTTTKCDNQPYPALTVQNLTFADGNAKAEKDGGGAIYAQGGRLKVVNSRFVNNVCADVGPDVGGGAIRALQQYNGLPVYVVNSTFGGQSGRGNVCSNGGALSSIDVSYTVLNSRFTHNQAIGDGANPAQAGTPGGGSGGAIYNDGNTFKLDICGSKLEDNSANEGGGGIFFVSNDRTGSLVIKDSTLQNNVSGQFENFAGMFVLAKSEPSLVNTVLK